MLLRIPSKGRVEDAKPWWTSVLQTNTIADLTANVKTKQMGKFFGQLKTLMSRFSFSCACLSGYTDSSANYGLQPGRICTIKTNECLDSRLNTCDEK